MAIDLEDATVALFKTGIPLPHATQLTGADQDAILSSISMREIESSACQIDSASVVSDFLSFKSNVMERICSKYKTHIAVIVYILCREPGSGYLVKEGVSYNFDTEIVRRLYDEYDMSDKMIAELLCVNRKTIQAFRDREGIVTHTHRAISLDHSYFSSIDSANKAYWLGFMYSDGTVYLDKPEIKLELKASDKDVLEKFKEDLSYGGEIRQYNNSTSYGNIETARIAFSSRQMQSDLFSHGCVSNKTLSLKPPPESSIPNEFIRDFVRGVVDGDGCLSHENAYNTRSIEVVGTFELLEWISHNAPVPAYTVSPHKTIYRIRWNCQRADAVVQWLYQDAIRYMDRKFARAKMFGVT